MPKGSAERDYRKPCTLCGTPRDVLVRCQIDETATWHFVCGSCWKKVSGGVIDGDGDHEYYRYGGMWKNKHEAVSAKKPKKTKKSTAKSTETPHSTEGTASEGDHKADEIVPLESVSTAVAQTTLEMTE